LLEYAQQFEMCSPIERCRCWTMSIRLGIRLMAMDDDLRTKATECIEKQFTVVLETKEFHTLPSIKLELIGRISQQSYL
jgi:hypothetical protein